MFILVAVTIILLTLYAWLIRFFKKGWDQLGIFVPGTEQATKTFISVLIPARNEAGRIEALLRSLQTQSYGSDNFEIILIDDHSDDHTAAKARMLGLPNLKIITPDGAPHLGSKKKAIATGIAEASGKLIVTTDADCLPSNQWLELLHSCYLKESSRFIAAPVRFSYNNSLLERFQALDFITLQGITAASVSRKALSMCNGANLAYEKAAFETVNGFEGIDHVASGDDMLLMHKISKQFPGSTTYLKHPDAIVSTPPMQSWSSFYSQRKRWASKSLVYDDKRIIAVLAFVFLLNLFSLLTIVLAFWHPFAWLVVVTFWLLKAAIEWPFVARVATFFGDRKLMPGLVYFQPLHMFYTVTVAIASQLGGYEWKGRKTK